MSELYKRPFRVRKMATGMQITIPQGSKFSVGDKTTVFYDGFMLVVPAGSEVDEKVLVKAIKLPDKGEHSHVGSQFTGETVL